MNVTTAAVKTALRAAAFAVGAAAWLTLSDPSAQSAHAADVAPPGYPPPVGYEPQGYPPPDSPPPPGYPLPPRVYAGPSGYYPPGYFPPPPGYDYYPYRYYDGPYWRRGWW